MTGQIPSSIGHLVNLTKLGVDECKFSGAFPSLKKCTNLGIFYADGNSFTNIPNNKWWGDLNNNKGGREGIFRDCSAIF